MTKVFDDAFSVGEPIVDVQYSQKAVQQLLEWAVNKVAIDQIKRHAPGAIEKGRGKSDLVACIKVEIGEVTFQKGIPPVRCFIEVDCGDNWHGHELSQSIEDSGWRAAVFPEKTKKH